MEKYSRRRIGLQTARFAPHPPGGLCGDSAAEYVLEEGPHGVPCPPGRLLVVSGA